MKNIYSLLLALVTIGFASCTLDPIDNPNAPTQESYVDGASKAQLQLLVNGVEASLRDEMEYYYQTVSIVGREYYDLNGTDPRYTGELLGGGASDGVLDNNGFLTTRAFAGRYRAARNCEVLVEAVQNSNAALSDAGKNGYYAFAKFCKGHNLLMTLNRQYNNGVRLDISNPDNLGPFVSYQDGLAGIQAIFDDAVANASSAGDAFEFSLSSGFSGFDTPAGLVQVIQGLKARVALYQGDNAAALSALSSSFMDMNGDLNSGAYHVFSAVANDRLNPLFYALGQDKYMVHPTYITDAEAGDDRLNKVTELAEVVSIDELSGQYQVQVYSSNTSPVAMVRNEELILIWAEANIASNPGDAVAGINKIRSAHGLGDYAGGQSSDELLREVLKQRRYSLFGEGHRWIDMRRTGMLGDLPLDRPGDQVFEQFPRPVLEQ